MFFFVVLLLQLFKLILKETLYVLQLRELIIFDQRITASTVDIGAQWVDLTLHLL
jgi:hypothetical protein